jgi:hypothetical protein
MWGREYFMDVLEVSYIRGVFPPIFAKIGRVTKIPCQSTPCTKAQLFLQKHS